VRFREFKNATPTQFSYYFIIYYVNVMNALVQYCANNENYKLDGANGAREMMTTGGKYFLKKNLSDNQ